MRVSESTGCGEVLVPTVSPCMVTGPQEGTSSAALCPSQLLPALGSLLRIPTTPHSPPAHPNSFCLWPALELPGRALFLQPPNHFCASSTPPLRSPACLGPGAVQLHRR